MRRLLLVFSVLVLGGCNTGTVGGLSLSLSSTKGISLKSYERGLWFDHDFKEHQPEGLGLKLDLVAGYMIRPVPKFWEAGTNPWKGDEPWFVIRLPMAGPFLSVAVGNLGAYCGFKTFKVADEHRSADRYGRWMHENEFPEPNGVHIYLQPSASLRRTRWK